MVQEKKGVTLLYLTYTQDHLNTQHPQEVSLHPFFSRFETTSLKYERLLQNEIPAVRKLNKNHKIKMNKRRQVKPNMLWP